MQATNLKCLSAVSVLLLTIVCTTVPALADVYITAALVGEENKDATKPDSTSEPNLAQRFALDVRPDNNANITEVTDTNDCLSTSALEYSDWVAWGKPDCWCYARQCRGDIDGLKHGPFWVQVIDLDLFKACFNKTDDFLPLGCICADLDHGRLGPFRVQIKDLDIFKRYFCKIESLVPECDQPPIYTGPYNFWVTP
jgi:hypothetical protein